MKKNRLFVFILILTLMLTGCMYPQEKLVENQIPYQDQAEAVQSAVLQFQQDNGGILPIKTRDMETPIYQKYPIDFKKITPKYMAEPPGNAFEMGGIFQYVLVDVEEDPKVKLLDLRIAEKIRELNLRIKMNQYPPYKDQIAENVFTLDFTELGYKQEPVVTSPYSEQNLPFVITGDAQIYVDYRMDLYQALQTTDETLEAGQDIRSILVKDSLIVPAYSLPYTVDEKTNEPIFLVK
ncbi:hypothetical protein LS684_13350 [Cytobacillus spongiae]|uniref:hypothetical protein n=1 Tax=Cytobacillus spongiae TaxID=2901381 RepID=UPI001F47C465|nr:hypothetical protein [Cytobacillus spongiae]UII57948.1 hypothetical protein LS684_13350 [Cytobacillus spongiae]